MVAKKKISGIDSAEIEDCAVYPLSVRPRAPRYLTDGTPKPWESQCQTCLRTENAGAYVLGTTAQQVRPQNNFEYSVDFKSTEYAER